MMDINQILFNSGMVGAFIVFAVVMARIESSERSKRDQQWREFMQTQNGNTTDYLDRERDQRKEVMSNFSANMDRVAEGMGELTKATGMHDDHANTRHKLILDAIEKINGGSN